MIPSRRSQLSRRAMLAGLPLMLAGCTSERMRITGDQLARFDFGNPFNAPNYGAITNEPFPVPAVPLGQIDPVYYRQTVNAPAAYAQEVGTLVVDPNQRFLYLIQKDGKALRYGVGVGREGFGWNGRATIRRKQKWPTWTPPPEMIKRDPRAAPYAKGMPGGPDNPLGARALYLYQGDRDTLYRIHGTIEPWTIGQAVSSGCIRLVNQDAIDLYERVPTGTRVVVLA